MIITWRKIDRTGGRVEVHQYKNKKFQVILINRKNNFYQEIGKQTKSKRKAIKIMRRLLNANKDALEERYF